MNLAQLIDAEAAQRARYAQPRQHGKVLGVIRHSLDRYGENVPSPSLVASAPMQEQAKRLVQERALHLAKEREAIREEARVRSAQARVAKRAAKAEAKAAAKASAVSLAQAQRLAAKKINGARKVRLRVPQAVNREILVQVLRNGPLAYRPLVDAFNAERRARGLGVITSSPAKLVLREARERGEVVASGDVRHFVYGLRVAG